jgi:hypothetical protein
MGLNKYRKYSNQFEDNGEEIFRTVEDNFIPDFKNRHTIQIWDISNVVNPVVNKWVGTTLTNSTLHEITIVNNSNATNRIKFTSNYDLIDEQFIVDTDILIGPNGTAHFYCTAILVDNNLVLAMRTGSQNKRKLD